MLQLFDFIRRKLVQYLSYVKGFRTICVNVLLGIMPILEMNEIIDILPQNYEAPYAVLIALMNLYLRSVTTTPIGCSR